MSTYDDASLVMIPSGYKTGTVFSQKPMSTNGQLTFTRSNDTATRVASNGLIEKVRTNLLLQSNTLSTTWVITASTTVTSGQAGYDGTNNAWLLKRSDTSARNISQNITQAASVYTFSVYAKAETVNWVYLYSSDGTNTSTAYFDLATGALGTTSGAITSKIESVGNGWYRCSVSYSDDITSVRIYPAVANGSITGGVSPAGVYIQDAQLETGDIATPYIATTTAARSVGPVANIPRIDYLGGGCGKLLLEPQRTNLALWSESFDNAAWTKSQTSITANNTTSPDGYVNADRLAGDGTSNVHSIFQSITVANATSYAWSFFAKKNTHNFIQLSGSAAGFGVNVWANFDLNNGVVGSVGSSTTARIDNYGNGWYRCTIIGTSVATTAVNMNLLLVNSATSARGEINTISNSVFLYGCQMEAGAYATSYVNTLAASVTRGADFAEKTSISSLVGGSEGTFFLELDYKPITSTPNGQIYVGSLSNIIGLASSGTNTLRVRINAVNDIIGSVNPSVRHKIAISFNASGVVCYVNGSSIALPNGASQVVSGLDTIGLNPSTRYNDLDVYQMLYFKTRLPNSELAALTTL